MLRVFQNDLLDPHRFLVTLELVPGREPFGQSLDTVKGIAADAFADGRVSAVSVTDNPGGNPTLSPDAIGHEVFSVGMDVIVHFACRDANRAGMESRALQLAMMGMKNILAVTGDYTGRGMAGRAAPVFDLDSVHLLVMLNLLSERIHKSGDPDGFFAGAAVSPFKYTEGESFAQYAKLCKKAAAGAQFIITQLGYDLRKFTELQRVRRWLGLDLPVLASVYLLSPRAARAMNRGAVPGAYVSRELLSRVLEEWKDPRQGLGTAIERTARLAVVLKGLGYRGVHIGGVHRSFKTVARVLDRMEEIQDHWTEYRDDFRYGPAEGFYAFPEDGQDEDSSPCYAANPQRPSAGERALFLAMRELHRKLFDFRSPLAPSLHGVCRRLDARRSGRLLASWMEGLPKKLFLDCRRCGDCGIQHVAFLCPESQCPKHTRNGACGGSHDARCEVYPDRKCVWFRAYQRWASVHGIEEMMRGCAPPRIWELDGTASWLNFHLKRDHQSSSHRFAKACRETVCRLPGTLNADLALDSCTKGL
jgi:methylenetetrahydrofolate reductase (NADPH)